MRFSTVIASSALVGSSIAGYVIEDDYSPDAFFSMFDFFTETDPTSGFVDYVDASTANTSSLVDISDGKIYMGVDHTSKASSDGRSSVRLTSNKAYNQGLVILDLEHFPGGICGTWPAFWMTGSDWPTDGEIDILEGVNSQVANQMTLHTGAGCSIASSGAMSGSVSTTDCYAFATDDNTGCAVHDKEADTFSGFNKNGGGVFATEINPDTNKIQIWFFDRTSIPEDITSGNPDPTSWGQPRALFSGGCEVSSHFVDMNIVFDTTFCGDWAGNTWSSDDTCAPLANTCDEYVQNNPEAFKEAYWSINSLKVYQSGGDAPASSSAVQPSSTAAIIPSIGLSLSLSIPAITPVPTPATTPYLSASATPTPTPPYPAGNSSDIYATGSIGNSMRSKTTVTITVTPDATPVPTPVAVADAATAVADAATAVADAATAIADAATAVVDSATAVADSAAASASNWQPGEPLPYSFFPDGTTVEETSTPGNNKVAHMMAHKKRAHGAWKK